MNLTPTIQMNGLHLNTMTEIELSVCCRENEKHLRAYLIYMFVSGPQILHFIPFPNKFVFEISVAVLSALKDC